MKPPTNATTHKGEPGSGNVLKGSPLKDTLKSGNTTTKRAGTK